MTEAASYITLALLTALAALCGAFFGHLRAQRQITQLREENAGLKATVNIERRTTDEKVAMIESARNQLTATFAALSSQALRNSTEEFLKLAQQGMKQFPVQAQSDLDQKEKAIGVLMQPGKEALTRTEHQLRELEGGRGGAGGARGGRRGGGARARGGL